MPYTIVSTLYISLANWDHLGLRNPSYIDLTLHQISDNQKRSDDETGDMCHCYIYSDLSILRTPDITNIPLLTNQALFPLVNSVRHIFNVWVITITITIIITIVFSSYYFGSDRQFIVQVFNDNMSGADPEGGGEGGRGDLGIYPPSIFWKWKLLKMFKLMEITRLVLKLFQEIRTERRVFLI